MSINRGEIWMVDFGQQSGEDDHLQHGLRPVVIVSNDTANRHSPVVHCVPLTSRVRKKRYMPTHVFISARQAAGLARDSIAQCEQLQAVNESAMRDRIGCVTEHQMHQIDVGIQVQLALENRHKGGAADDGSGAQELP